MNHNADASMADVVVVGGGVVGVACAHYLRDAGLDVVLIERGEFGKACSFANCGYICPSHVLPLTEPGAFRVAVKSLLDRTSPFYVRPRLNPSLWHWLLQFARRCTRGQMLAAGAHLKAILDSSMEEYRRLIAAEKLQCEWQPCGLLYVLQMPQAMDEFAATDRLLTKEFGVAARRIEGPQLPAHDPAVKPGLAGAFLYEDDAHLRPDALMTSWTKRLQERGVRLLSNCELQGVDKSRGLVTALRTSQGEMPVNKLVVAAGVWSAALSRGLGITIPMQPGKGYSLTTTRPDPCPRQSMLFPERRVGVTPFESSFRIGSMMEFAGFDAAIPERRIQQLRESVTPYLITHSVDQELSRWFGWRPMTWDSLPIIGSVPGLANAYLATGHNMLGMSLATATGKLIAEEITGQEPHIDIAAFSPGRFARTTWRG